MSASVLTFPKDPGWLWEPPRDPACAHGACGRGCPTDPASQPSVGSALLVRRQPIHHGREQMARHFQGGSEVSTGGQASQDSGGSRASREDL